MVNLAPCHLPNIDPTIHPELARPDAHVACDKCNMPDDEQLMLLCDACGTAYHTYCLIPPLDRVPPGEWVCPPCQKAGITVKIVMQTRAGRNTTTRNTDNLFPDAENKAKIQLARTYDGCLVPHKVCTKRGGIKFQYGTMVTPVF